MPPPHPFLTIHAEHQRDAYVIGLEGELDRSECANLDLALSEAEQTPASRIILDLEELTFIDSSGMETLLNATRRSATNGNRLKLTPAKGHPADMLRLTALDLTLPFTEPVGRTSGRSRGGWNASGLRHRPHPAEDADLPRLGKPALNHSHS